MCARARLCLCVSAYGLDDFWSNSLCPVRDRDHRWSGPAAPQVCSPKEKSLCTHRNTHEAK